MSANAPHATTRIENDRLEHPRRPRVRLLAR
jgi:hypothetical protein